ncbi:MAG TPA: MTH1187 family thiamine-binding protein [Candidatus Macondimonas sp.]|nr:MTH1187 family thiamine-binding protein [Candidatus Macondimonas sp.]
MRVSVDVCVIPMGVGASVSAEVARCVEVLQRHGLHPKPHPFGTAVEGEWDEVFRAIRACHETLHACGVPRLMTTLKVGTRVDKPQSLEDKMHALADRLSEPLP